MERITLRIKDKRKAQALKDFLQTLDFVEEVASQGQSSNKEARRKKPDDFFRLAGIWAKRDVSQETLRQKAWPERS